MNKSESITKIAPAIVAMQKELKSAMKDSDNPFFKSKYADLRSTWEADHEALEHNGLAIIQLHVPAPEGHIALETVLLHESGEWISGLGQVKLAKDDPQAYGSGTTYLRRQGRQAIEGVIPDDDDDANTASAKNPTSQTKTTETKQVVSTKPAPKPIVPRIIHEIPVTAVDGVTQAIMLDKTVQYCIKAGDKYYTTELALAKLAKEAHEKALFVKISYVEEETDLTLTLVNLVPLAPTGTGA